MALEPIIEGSELPGGELDRASRKGFIFSAIFLVLMLITVPIGIYLANNRTNILPRADAPAPKIGEISMKLDAPRAVGVNKEFKVAVLVHSDVDPANLFSASINFPTEKFEVVRIASESAEASISKKWIKRIFSNTDGTVVLTAGMASPGLKTEADKNYILGEIIFRTKTAGQGIISLNDQSAIYRNLDNINVLSKRMDANISVEGTLILSSPQPSCVARPVCLDKPDLISKNVKFASEEEELKRKAEVCKIKEPKEGWCPQQLSLEVTSPVGGEAYIYNQTIPITWKSSGIAQVQISLLINDELLGNIGMVTAKAGRFDWTPSQKLDLALVKPNNSFKIRLTSKENREMVRGESQGPFEIFNQSSLPAVATSSATLTPDSGDFNRDSSVNLSDLSILLSHYLVIDDKHKEYDINHDGYVNDVDLWLLSTLVR